MDAEVHFNLKKQNNKVSACRLWSILQALQPFSLSVVSSEHSDIKRQRAGSRSYTHDLPGSSRKGSQKNDSLCFS